MALVRMVYLQEEKVTTEAHNFTEPPQYEVGSLCFHSCSTFKFHAMEEFLKF